MKRRILLTGKNGQVGRELSASLQSLGDVAAFDRQQLDLTKPDQIREAIRSIHPDLIVNAAAYTAVDQAESDKTVARAVNTDAPRIMAEEAGKIGAALVHYSTDYIFDGLKTSPYVETDPANPINVYGRTKLQGEHAVQQSGVPHLIFRTAWVYGREGKNFLLTILRLGTQREELRIVRDQIGAPTSSREIAAATTQILAQFFGSEKNATSLASATGIYNLTAAGETNWYEFATAILEHAKGHSKNDPWFTAAISGRPLIARSISPITTAEYPTPARRPAYSILSNNLLAQTFGIRLRDWRTQLKSIFANDPAMSLQIKD